MRSDTRVSQRSSVCPAGRNSLYATSESFGEYLRKYFWPSNEKAGSLALSEARAQIKTARCRNLILSCSYRSVVSHRPYQQWERCINKKKVCAERVRHCFCRHCFLTFTTIDPVGPLTLASRPSDVDESPVRLKDGARLATFSFSLNEIWDIITASALALLSGARMVQGFWP